MSQWAAIKRDPAFAGHVVLFQLGQFMEAFHEDAVVLSSTLNIVLTQRGTHRSAPIPMAGIPMHSRDGFVARLMRAGLRVVLCEQVAGDAGVDVHSTTPTLMPRMVTQVVTPGTWLGESPSLSQAQQQRWLWCLRRDASVAGAADAPLAAAWCDVSTGQLHCAAGLSWSEALAHMVAFPPTELLVDPAAPPPPPPPAAAGAAGNEDEARLAAAVRGIAKRKQALVDIAGCDDATALTPWPAAPQQSAWPLPPMYEERAAGGRDCPALRPLLQYVSWTMRSAPPLVQPAVDHAAAALLHRGAPAAHSPAAVLPLVPAPRPAPRLWMDAAARRSLELVRPQHGRRRGRGSLLHAIDNTATAAGSRLLDSRLSAPLTNPAAIAQRLDAVDAFLGAGAAMRGEVRRLLALWPDVDRCLQRISTRRVSGGAGSSWGGAASQPLPVVRDLLLLRQALRAARRLAVLLLSGQLGVQHPPPPAALSAAAAPLWAHGMGTADAVERVVAMLRSDDNVQAPVMPPVTPGAAGATPLPTLLGNAGVACGLTTLPSPGASDEGVEGSTLLAARAAARLLEDALLESPAALSRKDEAGATGEAGAPDDTRRAAAPPAMAPVAVVRPGFSPALDHARSLRDGLHDAVSDLQDEIRRVTGVRQVRLKRTEEHGWVAEVPTAAAAALEAPGAAWHLPLALPTAGAGDAAGPPGKASTFQRVRTLKAAVRFKLPVLRDADRATAESAARADALECEVVETMCAHITAAAPLLTAATRSLAIVDVAAAHAELAHRFGLVRPAVVETAAESPRFLRVDAARHLVVERALMEGWSGQGVEGEDGEVGSGTPHAPTIPPTTVHPRAFVPNDIRVGGGESPRVALLTGANMGGKSTWLRSAAHIVILAHMGCFVPAGAACMSPVDAVFARIGASDDLARDRSTFLVEMAEMAAIARGATPASLVIIDELGRGTSAVDGLSLAWACMRHLADRIRCCTLFATHIHELVPLAAGRDTQPAGAVGSTPAVACLTMEVAWHGDGAVATPALTHRIVPVDMHRVQAWVAQARRSQPIASEQFNPGATSLGWQDSLGIHVARQAGLPDVILSQASQLAARLYDSGAAAAVAAQALAFTDGQPAPQAQAGPSSAESKL